MRPDGTRVKDLPPIVAAVPYIMPKRYDAWNSITEYIDEEAIKSYIREKRRSGVRINHMAVIIAAYYKATRHKSVLQLPSDIPELSLISQSLHYPAIYPPLQKRCRQPQSFVNILT